MYMQDKPSKIMKCGAELEAAPPISVTRFLQTAGISQVTFWRWECRGLIKTVRIAGRKYIPASVMAEFNQRVAAGDFAGKTQNPHALAAR